MSAPLTRRVRIDRIDLDLRGRAMPTAEAAALALGPALAKALDAHGPSAPDAQGLAATLGQTIVHVIQRETT